MAVEIINNRRVGITRTGQGAPMLMLHCALAHRGALSPLMGHLKTRSFTAFDMPGHGESEFDKTAEIQAQAVETAVQLLEATGPSEVFGHSFGATVALKLALERPDLVLRLSLYEPVYFSILAVSNPAAYAAEAKASAAFSSAALAQDWPAAASAFLARWSIEGFDKLPHTQKAYMLKTIPTVLASESSIIAPESGLALVSALANLHVPTLLMDGETAPKVIGEINNALVAHALGIVRKTIPSAGHMGPITHAAAVAAEILKFSA